MKSLRSQRILRSRVAIATTPSFHTHRTPAGPAGANNFCDGLFRLASICACCARRVASLRSIRSLLSSDLGLQCGFLTLLPSVACSSCLAAQLSSSPQRYLNYFFLALPIVDFFTVLVVDADRCLSPAIFLSCRAICSCGFSCFVCHPRDGLTGWTPPSPPIGAKAPFIWRRRRNEPPARVCNRLCGSGSSIGRAAAN